MSVRVFIRPGCTGMGSCARLAPQVFRLGADGRPEVLLQDAESSREDVLRAARACPFVGVEIDGMPIEERFTDTPVASVRRLSADIIELRLRCRRLPFVPGQYVFLRMRDARGDFHRTYSVVAAEDGDVSLCIRLVPNGRAGGVLSSVTPGTVLALSRAAGLFKLLTPDAPKLFVTGGTGVAPVLPMARAAAAAQKVVIFGARSEADLVYLDELRSLPNTRLVLVVQQPSPAWNGARGLVTDALLAEDLQRFAEIYTCGSPGMVEAVRTAATSRGFHAGHIFADAFVPAPASTGTAAAPAAPLLAAAATAIPATSISAPTAVVSPVAARWPRFDPLSLLRQVHYLASVLVCLLIVFFAATGFIANHTDWLLEGAPARRLVDVRPIIGTPADALSACRALFPAGSDISQLPGDGKPAFLVRGADGLLASCTVELDRHQATVLPLLPLSAEQAALADPALARSLVIRHGGELNDKSIEADGDLLSFDAESVWQQRNFLVDRAHRTYGMTVTREPLAKAISDLHRGKHAGLAQRLIMDVAAIALLIVALSGTVMGFQGVRRRRGTIILVSLSACSLLYLLINR